MQVAKGQPLARVWIESADILQKEADFLSALKRGDAERAAENLRLFGIPDDAIAEMRRSGAPIRSIVLRANASGIVLDKLAVPGMRFEAGEMLFMLADLSSVWLVARIAERDLALVAEGQTATIRLSAGGAPAVGLVTFIYPTLDAATRTASVRIEIPNPDGALKVGQYADIAIEAKGGAEPTIAVPESAILDSGARQVAFVAKEGGLFEPRDVTLGRRGDGEVEVTSGLSEGELIVVSGNFLIDAESTCAPRLPVSAPPSRRRDRRPHPLVRQQSGAGVDRWRVRHVVRRLRAVARAARRPPRSQRYPGHSLYRSAGPGAAGRRRPGHLSAQQRHAQRAALAGGARLLLFWGVLRLCHLRGRHRHLLGAQPRTGISQRRLQAPAAGRDAELGAGCDRNWLGIPVRAGWPSTTLANCGPSRTGRCGLPCRKQAASPKSPVSAALRKQYAVVVDPKRLAAFGVSLQSVFEAIRASNMDVGGGTIELSETEFMIRGRGYLTGTSDIEQVAIKSASGTPVLVRDVARVELAPDERRGIAELNGDGEVASGIALQRYGANALDVIAAVKAQVDELQPSLPEGVRVVPCL